MSGGIPSPPVVQCDGLVSPFSAKSELLAVPGYAREFLVSTYGVDPRAAMFIHSNEPQKVYVEQNGIVSYVDFTTPFGLMSSAPTFFSPTEPTSGRPTGLQAHFGASNFTRFGSSVNTALMPPRYREKSEVLSQRSTPIAQGPIPVAQLSAPAGQGSAAVANHLQSGDTNQEQAYGGSGITGNALVASQVADGTGTLITPSDLEWYTMTDIEREIVHKQRRKANAYKTALCQAFKDTGTCCYGTDCRFAHGEAELRLPPQTHPKYKTQLCNKFALYGRCPYGARCQFIHHRPNDSARVYQWRGGDNKYNRTPLPFSRGGLLQPIGNVQTKATAAISERGNERVSGVPVLRGNEENEPLVKSLTKLQLSHWPGAPSPLSKNQEVFVNGTKKTVEGTSEVSEHKEGCPAGMAADSGGVSHWWSDETESMFSQSCFPRILSDPSWSTTHPY